MRLVAVFDTNVLFSGVISKGSPFECVELARSGAIAAATSREIVDELISNLQTKLDFTPEVALDAAADFLGFLGVVAISGKVKSVPADPDDDKVLETALVAGATQVITGDRRHLIPIGIFQGISIVSPAEFLAIVAAQRPEG